MPRPVEFAAGSRALDLTDTISCRGREEIELLPTTAALGEWFVKAGLLSTSPVNITAEDLGAVRDLRDAIFQCVRVAIERLPLSLTDVAVLNRFASLPSFRPQLINGRAVLEAENPVQAALSLIAAEAIDVVTPPERDRLRACPGCNMLFLDRSRPGRRRWCSSASGCGNRAKVKHFRQRRATQKEKLV